jgi:hypothetical protein
MSQEKIYPLLNLTRKPRIYSDFEYGGDNLIGVCQEHLPDDSPFIDKLRKIKANYIEAVNIHNIDDVLENIENEYALYRDELISSTTSIVDTEQFNKKSDMVIYNEQQRLKIVEALGGKEYCKSIPIINYKRVTSYPGFNLDDIPEGNFLAQYEDPTGRKGVLMKLYDKKNNEYRIQWFNQRYRETELKESSEGMLYGSQSGGLWMGDGFRALEGVDDIVTFINKVSVSTLDHPYEVV